jgi:hypothetical protein
VRVAPARGRGRTRPSGGERGRSGDSASANELQEAVPRCDREQGRRQHARGALGGRVEAREDGAVSARARRSYRTSA